MSSITLDFCRLCFREDGNVSIFDYECDDAWSLADRIFECVSVQISQNDKLPQVICEMCLDHIIKWCTFKTTCDRNQRSWFLWLKSLARGTPQEIYEGLTENARRKSLELGYNHKINSSKSAFQRYNASVVSVEKPHQQDDDNVIIEEEMVTSQSNISKELKIESTQSLFDFYSNKGSSSPFEIPHKLSNGYMVVDSHNLPEIMPNCDTVKRSESSKNCSKTVDKQHDYEVENGKDNPETQPFEKDIPEVDCIDKQQGDVESNMMDFDPIDDDDNDAEVESVFNSELSKEKNEVLPEREKTLANSEFVSKCLGEKLQVSLNTGRQADNNEVTKSPDNSEPQQDKTVLQFPKPDIPKRFNTPGSVDKSVERLSHGKDSPRLTPQPKRPDTPYPHDILKNMAPVLDNTVSLVKVLPQPIPNALIKCLDIRVNPEKSVDSIPLAQINQLPKPPSSIKPLGFSKLVHPPRPSSLDRDSVSSDSSSFQQLFRVKQEPLSEPEDSENNESSLCNIYIKSEPMEFIQPMVEEQTAATSDLPPPDTTYCIVCKKHFSAHSQLLRHVLQSEIHKRLVSYRSYGHMIDNQVISQISKEVRAEGYYRRKRKTSYRKRKFRVRCKSATDLRMSDSVDSINDKASTIVSDETFECKVCNVILRTKGTKTKHLKSIGHKSRMRALNIQFEGDDSADASIQSPSERILRSSVVPQELVAGPSQPSCSYTTSETQQMSYSCPFAACDASFSDGGQLIVHMHTHGISLPMQEVNKQIEFNNKKKEKKQPVRPPVEHHIRNYVCKRCNRSYLKYASLSNHMRRCRVVPVKTPNFLSIPCPVCQAVQKNKRTLAYHMKTYHPHISRPSNVIPSENAVENSNDKFDYGCSICNKKFDTRLKMYTHNYRVHSKKPSTCKFCKKIFNSRSQLNRHYRNVHLKAKEGIFACYNCFSLFNSDSEVRSHRRCGCTPEVKLFSCSDCSQTFKTQTSLEVHKKEHIVELTVPKLEKPTFDLSFLEDLQNNVCKICSKAYCNYYNLRRHVKTSHLEESEYYLLPPVKSYKSDGGAADIFSSNIEKNLEVDTLAAPKSKSNESEKYNCFYCEATFSYTCSRNLHMKKVCRFTPPKVVCFFCKAERWPWITGDCANCGKDVDSRKRVSITKVKSAPKKIKTSETEHLNLLPPEFDETFKYDKKEPRLFKCIVGNRQFLSQRNMIGHSSTCDGLCKDQVVYCKSCHQIFPNPKVYLYHKPCNGIRNINPLTGRRGYKQRKFDPLRILPCKFCESKFKTKKGLGYHMNHIHNYYPSLERENKIIEARTSNRKSVAAASLNTEQPDNQEIIEDNVINIQDLTDGNSANAQGNYCPGCDRHFANHHSLVQHVKLFHKSKFSVLECTFCGKSILKKLLYEHGITCIKNQLVNINTLECVVCSTIFYCADDDDTLSLKLQEHIINCCGKLTTARGEKFKNKEKFLCLKCCMLFSSKKSLYAHSFERHGILIQTSPSQQKNAQVKDVIEGISNKTKSDSLVDTDFSMDSTQEVNSPATSEVMVSQPFGCHRCCKRFKTAKGLHSHKSSAHMYQARKKKKPDPTLKCKSCNRQFYNELKLRNHEKVHGIVKEIVLTEKDGKSTIDPISSLVVKESETTPFFMQQVSQIIETLPLSES